MTTFLVAVALGVLLGVLVISAIVAGADSERMDE